MNSIQKLIQQLSEPLKDKVKKLSFPDIELLEIYPKCEEHDFSIIKEILIYMGKEKEQRVNITDKITPYLNNTKQIIRLGTIDVIYEINKNFIPSLKKPGNLALSIIDCLSVSRRESPDLDLSKGYYLLTLLGNIWQEEVFPLLCKALKDNFHPCRTEFMSIFGDINFENHFWLERLTPYIIDFLSSDEEELIRSVTEVIKKQFPHFPGLLARFILPLTSLLFTGNNIIQEAAGEVILEISRTHSEFLTDFVPILIDYIKLEGKSQKAVILTGNAIGNLSSNRGEIDDIIKKIIKKDGKIEEIKDRKIEIARKIMEQAMITQEKFTIKEFIWLFGDDLFKEIPAKLVLNLYGEKGSFLGIYHEKNWLTVEGKLRFAHTKQLFTVAHPLDIFFANQIIVWQKIIMDHNIKQPFQQIFRSLYSLHMDEITEIESWRYSRQKLIPQKAKESFIKEGFNLEQNYASYNWKDTHIQIRFIWDKENSADKGLSITGAIQFYKILDLKLNIIDDKKIPLWQVEPKIFSETVRKLELVISKSIFRKSLY
jgi:hypothetical protein